MFRYLTDVDTSQMINQYMDNLTYTDLLNEMFQFHEREVEKDMRVFVLNNRSPTEVKYISFYFTPWKIGQRNLVYFAIFIKILQQGSFDKDAVRLDASFPTQNYANIPSKCVGDCAVCYDKDAGAEKFTYFPADIMLIGKIIFCLS